MKMDNVEQNSRFKVVKTVAYWVIGTVAAVPLTKMVESHYNVVSFFSSKIEAIGVWLATLNRLFENDIYVRIFALMVLLMAIAAVAIPTMSASVRRKRIAPYVSPFTSDEEAVLVAIGKMTRRSPALESQRIGKLTGLSVESAQRALKKLDQLKFTCSSYNRRGKALVELTPKGRGQFLKLAPFATLEIVPKC